MLDHAGNDAAQVSPGVDSVHVLCHPTQQTPQRRPLVIVEGADDCGLRGLDPLCQPEENAPADVGRHDLPLAPVRRVGATLDQARLDEVVDEVRHDRAVDPEAGRQGELARLLAVLHLGEDLVAAMAVREVSQGVAHGGLVGPQDHAEGPAEAGPSRLGRGAVQCFTHAGKDTPEYVVQPIICITNRLDLGR